MYKGASQSLQRKTGVQHIAPQKGYICKDVLPEPCSLTMQQCLDERVALKGELARVENELAAAKARSCRRDVLAAGSRKQALDQRLGIISDRMKALRWRSGEQLYRAAIEEVCPERAQAIEAKKRALESAVNGGGKRGC